MERLLTTVAARRLSLVLLFVAVLLPLVGVGALAEDVWHGEPILFDGPILEFLHAHANPTLDAIMLFFSRAGAPLPMTAFFLVVLVTLLVRGRRGDAIFFFIAVVGAMALNFAAKTIFGRARPDLWVSLAPESDYSFPSGHAMGSMAVVVALATLAWNTRWRWPVVIVGGLFVVMVGLSRIYLGVHYPSDVLAGWLASLAWVVGVALIRSSHFLRALFRVRRAAAQVQ
jgi:undecaprenyl-diphosphatase